MIGRFAGAAAPRSVASGKALAVAAAVALALLASR